MGSKLTHNELQAAVLTLDVNRDGYIQVCVLEWGLTLGSSVELVG